MTKLIFLFWGDYRNRWWHEWQERLKQAYGVPSRREVVREYEEEDKENEHDRTNAQR